MDSESEIFDGIAQESLKKETGKAMLMASGRLFSYWRLEHEGRYFFFKTPTEADEFAVRLLHREYELSGGCDHPYIARTFLYGEFLPGREGILMEYVDGRTLTDFLAENPSARRRRKVMDQLLEAMAYLHRKGIVHNDLKPDNILISRQNDALKLIDFGLADDDAHFLMKTPGCSNAFAAPELRDERRSDARSDVYSLGKIMMALFGSRYGRISRKSLRNSPGRRHKDASELLMAWKRRNRLYWITGGVAAAAIIFLGIITGIASYRESRNEQMQELSELQEAYDEVSGAYGRVNQAYTGLKDSLEMSRKEAETHQKAVAEAVEVFRNGLRVRSRKADAELRRCTTWREMNEVRQRYNAETKRYYESYPKTADGEDLTETITAIYTANLTSFDAILERHAEALSR